MAVEHVVDTQYIEALLDQPVGQKPTVAVLWHPNGQCITSEMLGMDFAPRRRYATLDDMLDLMVETAMVAGECRIAFPRVDPIGGVL